ncbi:hypothetical protein K438DRAFT_1585224, partial [Mycena galopus ATCC 62051]
RYGEVQFFFQATIKSEEQTLALISVYSKPDAELLEQSFQTIAECEYFGDESLGVIKVQQIQAGIGMVPIGDDGQYFVTEKLGLDIEAMGGAQEDPEDGE